MNTEEIKNIINQYFDNELTKAEEIILFTRLSQNEEARNYFKEMNMLKSVIDESESEFPLKLDERIFSGIKRKEQNYLPPKGTNKIFQYLAYAVSIILLAISLYFYNESIQYKNKLESSYQQVYQQNEMIKFLFNSLPTTEVKSKVENQIVVTSKM